MPAFATIGFSRVDRCPGVISPTSQIFWRKYPETVSKPEKNMRIFQCEVRFGATVLANEAETVTDT